MLNCDRRTNRLLSLLSDSDYERLRSHLSQVVLDYKKSLYEASRPIEHVYFPVDGVASLVITTADGASAEVGTIGSEGMVGLPVCLGDRFTSRSPGQLSDWTPTFFAASWNEARHCI